MSATISGAITFKGKNSVASPSGDTSTSLIPVPLLSLLLREMELKYKGSKLRYDSSRDKLTDSGGLLSLTVLSENCKVVLKKKRRKRYNVYFVNYKGPCDHVRNSKFRPSSEAELFMSRN